MYEPKLAELVVLKSLLSEEVWESRVRSARAAEQVMKAIAAKVDDEGMSLNRAVSETLPESKRSWAVRRWPRWKRHGLDGLIDKRQPPAARVTRACESLVTGARLGNPKLTVDEALAVLTAGGIKKLPSPSTIKRLFKKADAKRRYQANKQRVSESEQASAESSTSAKVENLDVAGAELLKAAEVNTGGIAALTDTAEELAAEVQYGSDGEPKTGDNALRDEGKLTAEYNRARKRVDGEPIASYLRPAQEKGRSKVAADFGFVEQSREALERKVAALVYEPIVNPGQGWDGLRSVAGELLEPLVGYAYMPATLQKLASELSQLGAGRRLLRVVGEHWHEVATEYWGEPGTMAALYVDNHAKEVWSALFTKAGKVSHRSRVMPCITTTYVQTGAGTPVVVHSQSGSAPLAPRLGELVAEAERRLDKDVRRAVVIDAEGSTYDILESFARQKRVIVTPCKPSTFRELELHYSAGSYYRPYRDGDELRVASATLRHKSTDREQEVGVLLVRREHRDSPFALLTTGLALDFKGRALADLYFERWPLQENLFKDGAVIGLDRHRGNCGRMVTNVAVATELEHLEVRLVETEEKLGRLNEQLPKTEQIFEQVTTSHRAASIELDVQRQRLDHFIEQGQTKAASFAKAAVACHEATATHKATEVALQRTKTKIERAHTRRQDLLDDIEKMSRRAEELEPMREIRQLDVALDTVLTAMKLTLAMLITFVLREYLPTAAMSTETFLNRVFTLRGRRETTADRELIVIYDNPRDPRAHAAVVEACEILNARALVRDGRSLSFAVEQRPP